MKRMKTILAAILVVALAATCLTACGGKEGKGGNDSTTVKIRYWNSGLGTDWLDAMIAAFEEKHPEYKVEYAPSADAQAVKAPFGNESTDETDLYMANTEMNFKYTEPLDDVLDSTVNGETKTIREKFDDAYLANEVAADGKIYELTYGGGAMGFVYNTKLFAEAGINTLPRTTNELINACDSLMEAEIVPLCHFKSGSYWSHMAEAWAMQYDGADYFVNNFWGCTDLNGNSPSKEVFTTKDGRYEALEVMEKLITADYVLTGSNTYEITVMQTKLVQGECAMMVTGSWVANEMKSAGEMTNFSVMKTPVISSIIDKLTTVTNETALRKVISAVDEVTDGKAELSAYQDGDNYKVDDISVSAEDWDKIYKARNTVSTNFSGETLFIPTYSNAKEGAKEFLKFLYSDEGQKIYADSLHLTLPLNYSEGDVDTSAWTQFEKDELAYIRSAEQIATNYIKSKHPIFYLGGADMYASTQIYDKFCASNANDRLNAETAWKKIEESVDNYYENRWLVNIGE